ncbi:hypothetical protein OIDMADRAFT_133653 [Oidiodendron maius Zn]|uniref:Carboxylesterase type B domain-containing protein n=1 Tax=Oidiodendron maius (strain Zn) TaxID=913774 RepID=A0A0C3D1P3_OIDMZ|nr:hypothetical protein OIDMADRAFT_133653 [Oidiodendron maius Zn]
MVDEFNCLNLNIWVPVAAKGNLDGVAMKTRLLVLVWVHGGSYMVGADGGFNLYDGTELARRSIKLNMPMIVVTFNYRVGILGYLHSCKLAEKVSMQTDIPLCFRSTANLGLLDAHMAFDWVMKHIHDFGGDPENIYGIGESAQAGTHRNYTYSTLTFIY